MKRKLIEKQTTFFEVINDKEQELKEKNHLIQKFKTENKKKERVLIAYKEQISALKASSGKTHTNHKTDYGSSQEGSEAPQKSSKTMSKFWSEQNLLQTEKTIRIKGRDLALQYAVKRTGRRSVGFARKKPESSERNSSFYWELYST